MTLYKQAICFICTHDIWTEKVTDVHCLWDDMGYSGRPVCWDCFMLLMKYCPKKLDVPMREIKLKIETGQISLKKWF